MNIQSRLKKAKLSADNKSRTELLENYIPFMLSEVSKIKGGAKIDRNDYEFSIAMSAFNEAIDKYNEKSGTFIYFASLVIKSRVLDYLKTESKHTSNYSLYEKDALNVETESSEPTNLKMELINLREVLKRFKLDLEDIADESPSHKSVREEIKELAKQIANEKEVVEYIYEKKRLPYAKLTAKFNTSKKILKYHRKFIIFIILILTEKCDDVSAYL